MSQPAQTSTALLEELRQRIRSEYAPPEPTSAERLATFGRGVLSNRGSFLDNLTAGIAAQEQAVAARAEQQRRALDMERQVVENAVREETERNRLAQNQAQFDAEGPTREARIRQINAEIARGNRPSGIVIGEQDGNVVFFDPSSPTGTRVAPGVRPLRSIDPAAESRALNSATTAANQAVLAFRANRMRATGREPSQEEIDTEWNRVFTTTLRGQGRTPPTGAGAAPPPSPGAASGGRPVIRETFVPPEERR
jgi:hypothetical protein